MRPYLHKMKHHPGVASGGDVLAAVPKCAGLPGQAPHTRVQEVRAHPSLQPDCQPGLQLLRPETHEHPPRQEELQLERCL